jgi:hypothetical protein
MSRRIASTKVAVKPFLQKAIFFLCRPSTLGRHRVLRCRRIGFDGLNGAARYCTRNPGVPVLN